MVAPIRAPHSRGVKCELCKKILAKTTWLDQTKVAKHIEEAQLVLKLFDEHDSSKCPCIPPDIKLLILGSTHFEIHRLSAKKLDSNVHSKQVTFIFQLRKSILTKKEQQINDCRDNYDFSRFNTYMPDFNDEVDLKYCNLSIEHLCLAIDLWNEAFQDENQPFNSKLALRLCLTHHVIYACYLFKFQHLLIYQLKASILLVNVFKSIDGVTSNAILHANYLLLKSLIDCNQHKLARQLLKKVITKNQVYEDKNYYESILLTCVASELAILDKCGTYDLFIQLEEISKFQKDDKLQHYYARTLAMSIMIKFAHCYSKLSDRCFEFFQTFRYISAIMRRCYDSSFNLILASAIEEKSNTSESNEYSSLDNHSWIRFAISDFVYSTFEMLTRFYRRCGLPECLEVLYNCLALIPHRTYNFYWISNISLIGSKLDCLCDKLSHAQQKLKIGAWLKERSIDENLSKVIDMKLETLKLEIELKKKVSISEQVICDLISKLKTFENKLLEDIYQIDYFDKTENQRVKLSKERKSTKDQFSLSICKSIYLSLIEISQPKCVVELAEQLKSIDSKVLEYDQLHQILEIILFAIDIDSAEKSLIQCVKTSEHIIQFDSPLDDLEYKFSHLSTNSENKQNYCHEQTNGKRSRSRSQIPILSMGRRLRYGSYQVSSKEQLTISNGQKIVNFDDCIEKLDLLTVDEILLAYLRHSSPNPDYLLYRRVHELMFSRRLKSGQTDETLLFHLTESIAANSMRYRWMMLNENSIISNQCSPTKSLSFQFGRAMAFMGSTFEPEKTIRSFIKSIPQDYRLVQLKYFDDRQSNYEHILAVVIESDGYASYIHIKNNKIESDELIFAPSTSGDYCIPGVGFPMQIKNKIDEAKKTLFFKNYKSRTENRDKIEQDLGLMLQELEDSFLGPFKVIFFGKILDSSYRKFVDKTVEQISSFLKKCQCKFQKFLQLIIEFAPYLTREEFCSGIQCLFGNLSGDKSRECYKIWLVLMESHLKEHNCKLDKRTYVNNLQKSQLGLALDKTLELIPWENLPSVRLSMQGVFRVPSLRLFYALFARNHCSPNKVDPTSVCFMLDPANNLSKTRERFETKLKSISEWHGTSGCSPNIKQLEDWLNSKDIFMFIGHGAGTTYYNKLANGRGLTALDNVNPLAIVMGCSSGRVLAEGPMLEPYGISWAFVLKGSHAFLGLLWDVTDTDIDRFFDLLLSDWIMPKVIQGTMSEDKNIRNKSCSLQSQALTDAVFKAKLVCRHRYLVGSTPVVFGLPVWTD